MPLNNNIFELNGFHVMFIASVTISNSINDYFISLLIVSSNVVIV